MKSMSEFIAKYDRDGFLITISSRIEIFDKISNQIDWRNEEYVAVFTHEYWHSLLHLSTITRIRDWVVYLSQISLFTKTLMHEANGSSNGNNNLEKEDLKFIEDSFDYLYYQHGEFKTDYAEFDDFKIISEPIVHKNQIKPRLSGREVPLSSIQINCDFFVNNETVKNVIYAFSVLDIEESIADAIETMIYKNTKNQGIKYNLIKKLFQYYKLDIHDYHLIGSLGTLALLTTDPPFSLINLIKEYKRLLIKDNSKIKALSKLKNDIQDIIIQYEPTLQEELDSISKIYKNREPLETATAIVINRILALIKRRLANPTFDVDCFISGNINWADFSNLLFKLHQPAIALQERSGTPGILRDNLITMDDTVCKISGSVDYPIANLFKVLSLLDHFFKAHNGVVGIRRSEIVELPCLYANSCDALARSINGEICISKPWELLETKNDTCEYCQMVQCLIGETKIRST